MRECVKTGQNIQRILYFTPLCYTEITNNTNDATFHHDDRRHQRTNKINVRTRNLALAELSIATINFVLYYC